MAELQGLRPLRELLVPGHAAAMNGAYDIFVQDDHDKASDGQPYYAAKWLRLKAGTYMLKHMCDDTAQFYLDGVKVADSILANEPALTEFTVAQNGVYRWDVMYQNHVGGIDPAWAGYALLLDGTVIEVSRANDFIGDVVPIPDAALGVKPPYNSDARLSYPVFLPKPDWKSGMIERLEWLTDVLTSETGAEQRRKLRQVPRRSLEAMFNAFGNHRNLIDSYITGVGANYGLLPLWYDESAITSTAVAGSVDLFGDFAYRDYNVNDVVLIRRGSLFDYELNVVAEKRDGQLVLAFGLSVKTPVGATVTPVRVAQLRDASSGTLVTDEVQQYSLRFYTIENYEITPAWNMPVYQRSGLPILTLEPNYRESTDLSFTRGLYPLDNDISAPVIRDPGGQASTAVQCSYHIYGRAEMYRMKQLLFAMSGRWREFHLPSGHNDFELSRDVDGGQGALIAYRTGFSQFINSRIAVRSDVLIELWDGQTFPNTIISSRVVGDEEWLFLTETVPSIAKDSVKRISYMPRARLNIDSVELNRITDADGATTLSLSFQTFAERRVAPPITFP